MQRTTFLRVIITAVMVVIAAWAAHMAWAHYQTQPWTRDARVRADIIKVAADVSGLVTRVVVKDNQHVKKGDVLFEVDPVRYQQRVEQVESDLARAKANVEAMKANQAIALAAVNAAQTYYNNVKTRADRREHMNELVSGEEILDSQATAEEALADLQSAKAQANLADVNIKMAEAEVLQSENELALARIDYERTQVTAAADGTITNLDIKEGDYASEGQASLALVKDEGMWIYGYFEETKLPQIHIGDDVKIVFMAGDVTVHGEVESIAGAIADNAADTSADMVSNITPTFSWVRLAQRIPVRVRLPKEQLPEHYALVPGMSATVTVLNGKS